MVDESHGVERDPDDDEHGLADEERPVPRVLAMLSENRPKASSRTWRPREAPRPGGAQVGAVPKRIGVRSCILMWLPLPPARGQDPVQDVVDGDRAEQAAVLVAHGDADQVVRGHAPGHFLLGQVRPDEGALLDALADAGSGGLAQQPLEPDRAR